MIEANLPAFLEHLQEHDAALPRFVTDEFKDYLRTIHQQVGYAPYPLASVFIVLPLMTGTPIELERSQTVTVPTRFWAKLNLTSSRL